MKGFHGKFKENFIWNKLEHLKADFEYFLKRKISFDRFLKIFFYAIFINSIYCFSNKIKISIVTVIILLVNSHEENYGIRVEICDQAGAKTLLS